MARQTDGQRSSRALSKGDSAPRARNRDETGQRRLADLTLVRNVSQRFNTRDQDELRAELSISLLKLTSRSWRGVENPDAYLAKALLNKASNLVRNWRKREYRTVRVCGGDDQGNDSDCFYTRRWNALEDSLIEQLALAEVWRSLGPQMRLLWTTLIHENGNQVQTAKRLRKHRNTIRSWIQEIRTILTDHGY